MGGLSEVKDGPHPAQPFAVVVSANSLAADKRREFGSPGTGLLTIHHTLQKLVARPGLCVLCKARVRMPCILSFQPANARFP